MIIPMSSPNAIMTAVKTNNAKSATKENVVRHTNIMVMDPNVRYIGMQYLRTGLIMLANLNKNPH